MKTFIAVISILFGALYARGTVGSLGDLKIESGNEIAN